MRAFAPTTVWRPELAIVGLAAGLLTTLPAGLANADANVEPLIGGAWFGLALATYFLVVHRGRSIGRAVSIVAVSAAALWLATWAAMFAYGVFRAPSTGEHVPAVPLGAWFVGGLIGACIVSTTTFYLYGTSREGVRTKIVACTIVGGILGVIGHESGRIPMFGGLAPQSDMVPSILFIIWQTGMGFVMGLVWPDTVVEKPEVLRRALPVPILAKIFIVVVLVPFVFTAISAVRVIYQERQRAAASAAPHSGRP